MPAPEIHGALFQPGSLRVKICGITNAGDAAMAAGAGADAIGINLFSGSKRFVEIREVRDWLRDVPVTRVAVVVNASAELLVRIQEAGVFDAVQFHGDETPEFCAACALPWLRAVRVSGAEALEAALAYETGDLLLDAHSAAGYGGTGAVLDLDLAAEFVRGNLDHRVLIAGGLRPETVAAAVRTVHPHGVDVASGVEMEGNPRRKDPVRVRAFIDQARGA
ncbi:MAG TPA: phosphoribosylanthranilate isomerase [Chthoniobacterales bacterium]